MLHLSYQVNCSLLSALCFVILHYYSNAIRCVKMIEDKKFYIVRATEYEPGIIVVKHQTHKED